MIRKREVRAYISLVNKPILNCNYIDKVELAFCCCFLVYFCSDRRLFYKDIIFKAHSYFKEQIQLNHVHIFLIHVTI